MNLHLDSIAYDTGQIGRKWTVFDETANTWTVEATGPGSRRCLKRVSTSTSGTPGSLTIAPKRTQAGIWIPTESFACGFRLNVADLSRIWSGSGVGQSLLEILGHHLISGQTEIISIRLGQGGTIAAVVEHNPNPVVVVTTGEVVTDDTWIPIQLRVKIHSTEGEIKIYVGATADLVGSFEGDTRASRSLGLVQPSWNAMRLLRFRSEASPFLSLRFMDFWINDLSGDRNNGIYNPARQVRRCKPVAVGGFDAWTPSEAADNYTLVNDAVADDDATYVEASEAATRDEHVYESVPAGVNPDAVMVSALARKTGDGSAALAMTCLGVDGMPLGVDDETYRYVGQSFDVNPFTEEPFLSTDLTNPLLGYVKTL